MNTRRVARAAEAIRESVSTTVLFDLRDPRVKNVTVLRADVSGDLRNAKVYVSIMGDAKTQSLTMHGLESARGFIQSKVADRLQTKNTPVLKFVLDPGVKLSAETSQTLRSVFPEGADSNEQDGSQVQGEENSEGEDIEDEPLPGDSNLKPDDSDL